MKDIKVGRIGVGDLVKYEWVEGHKLPPKYGIVLGLGKIPGHGTVPDDSVWCYWMDSIELAKTVHDGTVGYDIGYVSESYDSNIRITVINSAKKLDRFESIIAEMI